MFWVNKYCIAIQLTYLLHALMLAAETNSHTIQYNCITTTRNVVVDYNNNNNNNNDTLRHSIKMMNVDIYIYYYITISYFYIHILITISLYY